MIKEKLEQAARELEIERERLIATTKERIVREKIAPYNTEIDNAKAKDLAKLDAELNSKIVALQKEYRDKKQALITRVEQEKQKYADTVFTTELAVITIEHDKHINKLKAQIAEIEE